MADDNYRSIFQLSAGPCSASTLSYFWSLQNSYSTLAGDRFAADLASNVLFEPFSVRRQSMRETAGYNTTGLSDFSRPRSVVCVESSQKPRPTRGSASGDRLASIRMQLESEWTHSKHVEIQQDESASRSADSADDDWQRSLIEHVNPEICSVYPKGCFPSQSTDETGPVEAVRSSASASSKSSSSASPLMVGSSVGLLTGSKAHFFHPSHYPACAKVSDDIFDEQIRAIAERSDCAQGWTTIYDSFSAWSGIFAGNDGLIARLRDDFPKSPIVVFSLDCESTTTATTKSSTPISGIPSTFPDMACLSTFFSHSLVAELVDTIIPIPVVPLSTRAPSRTALHSALAHAALLVDAFTAPSRLQRCTPSSGNSATTTATNGDENHFSGSGKSSNSFANGTLASDYVCLRDWVALTQPRPSMKFLSWDAVVPIGSGLLGFSNPSSSSSSSTSSSTSTSSNKLAQSLVRQLFPPTESLRKNFPKLYRSSSSSASSSTDLGFKNSDYFMQSIVLRGFQNVSIGEAEISGKGSFLNYARNVTDYVQSWASNGRFRNVTVSSIPSPITFHSRLPQSLRELAAQPSDENVSVDGSGGQSVLGGSVVRFGCSKHMATELKRKSDLATSLILKRRSAQLCRAFGEEISSVESDDIVERMICLADDYDETTEE